MTRVVFAVLAVSLAVPLAVSLAGCGGDDAKTKKAKEAKVPKPASPAERAEVICQADCTRGARCDDTETEPCLKRCRQDLTRRMHVYRPRFAAAYADCLDRLPCSQEIGRCQVVAVATVMEDPDADAKKAEKEKADKEKKAKQDGDKKKKKPDVPPKKKDPRVEKQKAEQREAARVARELFSRCHDRRVACDGQWEERCNAAAALNDGGRARVRACLAEPCDQVRRCLQDAVNW